MYNNWAWILMNIPFVGLRMQPLRRLRVAPASLESRGLGGGVCCGSCMSLAMQWNSVNIEYPEVNISHLGKGININKRILAEDMLVPWSFHFWELFFGFGYWNSLVSIHYGMFIAPHIDEANNPRRGERTTWWYFVACNYGTQQVNHVQTSFKILKWSGGIWHYRECIGPIPTPRIPVANDGLAWDSLLKM